jgi:hypothetical protein
MKCRRIIILKITKIILNTSRRCKNRRLDDAYPLGTEPVKTEAATQFILQWAQGTPDVVIELKQAIMDLSDANPQLGFIYMAQFSKYAIQHKTILPKRRLT